jgi:hypothetical protein
MPYLPYWSSTTVADLPPYLFQWQIDFGSGSLDDGGLGYGVVRCVRQSTVKLVL